MISKKNKANLFLLCIIFLSTVLYGYFLIQNRGSIKVQSDQISGEIDNASNIDSGITKFSDVEYKTTTKKNVDYITRGKLAFISKNQPELILLEGVHSFTKLDDGSFLNVNSGKAKYSKNNKNIKYYDKVIITNREKIITAEIANFFPNKNLISLADVVYKDEKNLIKTDFAELDTITNNIKMFMKNSKDRVYGQRK